jgi:hypothetical protein
MASQLSQGVTLHPDWRVKLKRLLAEHIRFTCASSLVKWAVYAYAAQALTGFAIGFSIPWIRLFTKG